MNYYRQYPFVAETVVADIYDEETICNTINRVISYSKHDTSVLILSDDTAINEEIDSHALANLVYVQDIIKDKIDKDPEFDTASIDVIVEIIDPKHHDLVNSYDINNIVISNRYISKMITQIGEKDAIYNFYNDILTYDVTAATEQFKSKEVYAKKVKKYFSEIPKPCKADELVRAVYNASLSTLYDGNKIYPSLVLGYVKRSGEVMIFSGDLSQIDVNLEKDDKIILYAPH